MTRGRTLIADPSALVREGLRRLVRQARFEVCAEGRDVSEALAYIDDAPDLALIICTIEAQSSQQSLAQLKDLHRRNPATRIIVMTDTTVIQLLWEDLIPICDAVLERDISGEVLQRSIDLVVVGQKFLSAPLLQALSQERKRPAVSANPPDPGQAELLAYRPGPIEPIANFDQPAGLLLNHPKSARRDLTFSDRERQILECLVRGDSNKVIARELSIAEATVKVHVKGLLRKLRTSNRTQAAVWALNSGLVRNGIEVLAAD